MKNKLLAVLATFGMVATASAVKINNNISINGFIDGSYHNVDRDGVETSDLELDEVELNFLVNAGNVSGELHIDNNNGDESDELDIEQVHFTYSFGNGADLTVGRFGSALGFEREDPAGLYTFSRAYDANFNFGDIDTVGAQEGLRVGYSAGDFAASLSLYNQVGDNLKEGEDPSVSDDLDYEVAISYTGIDNLTVGLGIQNTRNEDDDSNGDDEESYVVNAAYTLNKLLLAAEYANTEEDGDGDEDLSAYMILADYDVSDKLGFAVRYSNWESVEGGNVVESDKLTFAPNYAITDSLGAIVEFSAEETGDVEEDSFAVELTYTF